MQFLPKTTLNPREPIYPYTGTDEILLDLPDLFIHVDGGIILLIG